MSESQNNPATIKTVAVIGAGFSGLIWCQILKAAGYEVIVFEKTTTVGGVWSKYANDYSCVQIVESEYFFESDYANLNITDFTPRSEILERAKKFIADYDLESNIRFECEVTHVKENLDNTFTLDYIKKNKIYTACFDAVACLTGGLCSPREINYPGEEEFEGQVAYGISTNINPKSLKNKTVLIVGMGAFAMENAREAILQGAKKVYIVARDNNVVFSKYFSYKIAGNFSFSEQEIVDIIKKPYEMIGQENLLLSKLKNSRLNQRAAIISDFFFIASYYKKLVVIKGEVKSLHKTGVIIANENNSIDCDYIIKCLGFNDTPLKPLFEIDHVAGIFINKKNNFAYFHERPLGDLDFAHLNFGSQSIISDAKTYGYVFLYFLKNKQHFCIALEEFPEFKHPPKTISDVGIYLGAMIYRFPGIKYLVLSVRLFVAIRTKNKYSESEFIKNNKREWAELCKAISPEADPLAYPFKEQPSSLRTRIRNNLLIFILKYKFRREIKKLRN